jgi:hypothetical protein
MVSPELFLLPLDMLEGAPASDAVIAVEPALAAELADRAARDRVLAVARTAPLTRVGGFECHLGTPQRLDFALRVPPDEPARNPLPTTIDDDSSPWRRDLWIEYDLPPDAPPTVGYALGPGAVAGVLSHPTIAERRAWLDAVTAFAGIFVEPDTRLAVFRAYDALPPAARVAYLGSLPGRPGVRVAVRGLARGEVVPFLSTVGWHGDPATVEQTLHQVAGAELTIDLDLGVTAGPVLGVEVAASDPGAWPDLLPRTLAAAGVDTGPVGALLAWPGTTSAPAWSINRRVSHLKLLHGDGPVRAKAYLLYALVLQPPDDDDSRRDEPHDGETDA